MTQDTEPDPTPDGRPDATPEAPVPTGLAVLALAQSGRFAEIRDLFAPPLQSLVSAEALQAGWNSGLGPLGALTSVGTPTSEPAGPGSVVVRIPLTLEQGKLTLVLSATDGGWLTGLQLAPAEAAEPAAPWKPPAYADPEAFDEQDVTVGHDSLAVPGTLSLPHGPGRLPAVVLLGGSGPSDRDATIGRNKPFRDLAWGLATAGVAVLRFDKVTYVHPQQCAGEPDFTASDEYVPHAVAAVQLLQQHPSVDPARVFVLGHSLGGTIAPRVAAAEPSVAGLVLLAGGAQPLHWAAVRQIRYLASLNPETAAASESVIEAMSEQARAIDSPDFSASTPTAELPFGVPAPYWLDLRDYDPAGAAAALGKPMLVLQGGRDYQATVADDLAVWRAALADRPDVAFRVLDADNHFFFPGSGASTPAEYEPVQHMDPAAVAEIAAWLNP
jgi:dienelactone hydrolase